MVARQGPWGEGSVKRSVLSIRSDWARDAPPALLGAGLGGLIVLSRLALQDSLGAKSPFILAWPAIMIAAFTGGFWPAIAVSGLGRMVGPWAIQPRRAAPPRPRSPPSSHCSRL